MRLGNLRCTRCGLRLTLDGWIALRNFEISKVRTRPEDSNLGVPRGSQFESNRRATASIISFGFGLRVDYLDLYDGNFDQLEWLNVLEFKLPQDFDSNLQHSDMEGTRMNSVLQRIDTHTYAEELFGEDASIAV